MNLHEPQISRAVRWQWWQITHPMMSIFIHLSSLYVGVGIVFFFYGRLSSIEEGLSFLRVFLENRTLPIVAMAAVCLWVMNRKNPLWRRFIENYRRYNPELATQFEALGRRDGLLPYEEKFTENKSD